MSAHPDAQQPTESQNEWLARLAGVTPAPLRWTYDTEPCSRCGGSGHHSRCEMYGTTCFKCSGRKVTLTRRAAKVGAQLAEIRNRRQVAGYDLRPGMTVCQMPTAGRTYRTVESATPTTDWCAKANDRTWYFHEITFTDGTHARVGGELWVRHYLPAELEEIAAIVRAAEGKGLTIKA
jgi:hypothetical protein